MTEVCIRLEWHLLGSIIDEGGKIVFPTPPARPGVYRFDLPPTLKERVRSYIGQTDGLPRRFMQYRNPGPSQHTNIRIHALLVEVLNGGGEVQVLTAVAGDLSVGGEPVTLDFMVKAHRLLAEGAAVVAASAEDVTLINL